MVDRTGDSEHLARAAISSHESTIKFAELAVRSLLLLTGGAAVAILSFAGSQTGLTAAGVKAYACAVELFGGAAAGAVLTAGVAYLAQGFYTHDIERRGDWLRGAAIFIWLASLAAFAVGVTVASDAVIKSSPTAAPTPNAAPASPSK